MKKIHILNGDCISEQLNSIIDADDKIICRECLVTGPLDGETLEDFWEKRSQFISEIYGAEQSNYNEKVVKEIEKLIDLKAGSEVYLWFEDDLFCQVNMWFVLSLLAASTENAKIHRVFPNMDENPDWRGFSNCDDTKLTQALADSYPLTEEDVEYGEMLWNAYRNRDWEKIKEIAQYKSPAFRFLPDIYKACKEGFPTTVEEGRPHLLIKELKQKYPQNFSKVFEEFSLLEGIYGYGDAQVKSIYDAL